MDCSETQIQTYKPIAQRLRNEGRTLKWLYGQALAEGKGWSYHLFKIVANGWHNHEEIEAWLREKGFGGELEAAQSEVRKIKLRKLREEAAEYGNE